MGASAGIMIAKDELKFPDAALYAEWPAHSVELCLENYLSLRKEREMDMDGQIPIRFDAADLKAWPDPPFGMTVEPFLAGVARIKQKGEMDRQSIRRASAALADGELLIVREVAAGSPAATLGVEVDWLLSTVCGRIPANCVAVKRMCDEVDATIEPEIEMHFAAGPFNHSGAPPLDLTRPLWLHVFADPTETNSQGECLSLPLTAMKSFAAAFPPENRGRACGRPPLIILALLCQDSLTSKLEMVFSCLDVKNKISIPVGELPASVALLVATLHHVKFLKKPLDARAIQSLAGGLAGHADARKRVTCDGFVEWGRRESKGGLLAALAHSTTGKLGKYRKPVTLDATDSKEAHRRARKRYELGPASALAGNASSDREDARARRYGSGHAQTNAKKLGVQIADADLHGDQSAKYELEKKRKRADGRVKAVASQSTMSRLVASVDLSYEDLHNLRIEFAEASDRSGKEGPYLTCNRLKEMLLARFPSLENGRVLGDMLRVFDVSGANKIYFPEFARAIARLVGSFEEQMAFIFELCDRDANGQLELWELSDLISDASDDMHELGEHIKARLPGFDDGDGVVDMLDFEALLKGDAHLYLNFYWTWLPFIGGPLLAGLERLEACCRRSGVAPDTEFALALCPKFSCQAGLAPNGDWKVNNLQFAAIFFEALGLEMPPGESFRTLETSPAKEDAVGRASPVDGTAAEPAKKFFPDEAAARDAALGLDLRKATTTVFREVLDQERRRAAAESPKGAKDQDQFGDLIDRKPPAEVGGARLWAVVAHYFAARGLAGATKSTRNLNAASPTAADFDAADAVDHGATVHAGRLVSVPHAIQAAIVSRVAAFESIEDDFHPDPVVSPSSSRRLSSAPALPRIPMAKLVGFTDEVCAVHADWEVTLNDAFLTMDVDESGAVSFDELLKYSRMNRELFQLMIGTGNRHTKGVIAYDAIKADPTDAAKTPPPKPRLSHA